MSLFIQNNNGPIYSDCTITINNGMTTVMTPDKTQPEDIPAAPDAAQSCLFTKKTRQENKAQEIIMALQQSLSGRHDKARALVEELRQWQRDGYVDSNYNARVMYDQLNLILTLPFQYDGFRKYYNE